MVKFVRVGSLSVCYFLFFFFLHGKGNSGETMTIKHMWISGIRSTESGQKKQSGTSRDDSFCSMFPLLNVFFAEVPLLEP